MSKANKYEWFVSGYISNNRKFLYCYLTTLFLEEPFEYPTSNTHFPRIMDGGTSVCRGVFDVEKQSFTIFKSNGMA